MVWNFFNLQTYIKKFEFYTPPDKNRGRNCSTCN